MHITAGSRRSWAIPVWLYLLAISILINYVDRGNLAVAWTRLALARMARAPIARIAKEERRFAIAQGIRDGLRR